MSTAACFLADSYIFSRFFHETVRQAAILGMPTMNGYKGPEHRPPVSRMSQRPDNRTMVHPGAGPVRFFGTLWPFGGMAVSTAVWARG